MLGKVLNQFYDGRWKTSPVPTNTIDDYDGINWVGTPPSKSEVEAKLAELIAAEPIRLLREKRTLLLAETDWVVIRARENGGQVPVAWKTYRQKLRDLPTVQSSVTSYDDINWPSKPS